MTGDELPVWHVVDIEMDDSLSCPEKLTEVQDIVDSLSYQSLPHVSMIMEDSGATEPELCLETAFLIATEIRGYFGELKSGLQAVGDADIATVNGFIIEPHSSQNCTWRRRTLSSDIWVHSIRRGWHDRSCRSSGRIRQLRRSVCDVLYALHMQQAAARHLGLSG